MTPQIPVILIDDNDSDRELFCRALKKCGDHYRCHTFSNCLEALDQVHSGNFEKPLLIFLDLKMSLMGGLHCLSLIKREDGLRSIPVVVLSGSAQDGDSEEAVRLGAMKFLTKPTSLEELTQMLQDVLDKEEKAYTERADHPSEF